MLRADAAALETLSAQLRAVLPDSAELDLWTSRASSFYEEPQQLDAPQPLTSAQRSSHALSLLASLPRSNAPDHLSPAQPALQQPPPPPHSPLPPRPTAPTPLAASRPRPSLGRPSTGDEPSLLQRLEALEAELDATRRRSRDAVLRASLEPASQPFAAARPPSPAPSPEPSAAEGASPPAAALARLRAAHSAAAVFGRAAPLIGELCIRLQADGTSLVLDTSSGEPEPPCGADPPLFELRLRGRDISILSMRVAPPAAQPHDWHPPAQAGSTAGLQGPPLSAPPSMCSSPAPEPAGGAHLGRAHRALFDARAAPPALVQREEESSSPVRQQLGAARLDLSGRGTLRHIAEGRLGDALLEASSPLRASAPRFAW